MSNDSCSKCRPGKLCPGCDAIVTELAAALAPPPASPARTTGEERESVRRCAMVDWRRGWVIESEAVLRLLAERDALEAESQRHRDEWNSSADLAQKLAGQRDRAEARATAAERERDRAVGLLGEAEQRITDPLRFDGSHGFSSVVRVFLASLSPATAAPVEPGKGPTACEHCGLAESMCLCHEEVTP